MRHLRHLGSCSVFLDHLGEAAGDVRTKLPTCHRGKASHLYGERKGKERNNDKLGNIATFEAPSFHL